MAAYHHTIDYGELKQLYIDVVAGKKICKYERNNRILDSLVGGWSGKSSFYGPSSKEVIEWLHNGYKTEGLTLDPPIEPIRQRRRLQFAEEGELQLDLVYSGHDYPFLTWTKRMTMPGMLVNMYCNFQAGTRVDVIIAYYRFCLRSLVALENSGIDLEVQITSDSQDIFTNGNRLDTLHQHVTVKKEGENTDYLGWSAMISPGGYRHLMFLEHVIGCDRLGRTIDMGLGRGMNMHQGWKVEFDVDERKLTFRCPWHPSSFPEEEMEMSLREVLLNARRAA